jgi:hypothetical protein
MRWKIGEKGRDLFCFTVKTVCEEKEQSSWSERASRLHVHEFALSKRCVGNASPFTRQLSSVAIDSETWLSADLPVTLAEKLLDDRPWKRAHLWAVPVLAQWREIKSRIPKDRATPEPIDLNIEQKPE